MSVVKRTNSEWFPSMLNDMLQTDWLGGVSEMDSLGANIPPVNVQDNEDNFVVELAAPGKKKEDFKLELDNEILTISSEEKQEEVSDDKTKFTLREFSYKAFERKFTLPETVDNGKISASYEDGILKIEIPKREEAKPAPKRLIDIA